MKKTIYLFFFLLSATFLLQAQEASEAPVVTAKFGEGIRITAADKSFQMKIGMRMQALYAYNHEVDEIDLANMGFLKGQSDFLIRRFRLKFDGYVLNPRLKYKIEMGMSNRDMESNQRGPDIDNPGLLLDAVVKYQFAKKFELWVGQTKLPGNRERVISSANLELVDRSLLNSRFNIDRDMGFWLTYATGKKVVFRSAAAITSGEGRNRKTGPHGLSYTVRGELLPLGAFSKKGDYFEGDLARERTPKLSVGAVYNFNDNAIRTQGQLGRYFLDGEEKDIHTVFADMIFKYRGWAFMAEYAWKDTENPISPEEGKVGEDPIVYVYAGQALNLQTSYVFKNNLQLIGRVTTLRPHAKIQDLTTWRNDYTLGISKYFVGHRLKIQSDISYSDIPGDDKMSLRMQLELHF